MSITNKIVTGQTAPTNNFFRTIHGPFWHADDDDFISLLLLTLLLSHFSRLWLQ